MKLRDALSHINESDAKAEPATALPGQMDPDIGLNEGVDHED